MFLTINAKNPNNLLQKISISQLAKPYLTNASGFKITLPLIQIAALVLTRFHESFFQPILTAPIFNQCL